MNRAFCFKSPDDQATKARTGFWSSCQRESGSWLTYSSLTQHTSLHMCTVLRDEDETLTVRERSRHPEQELQQREEVL